MANIKKMENPRDVLIKIDRKEYETFVENLPRTRTFSDAIRKYIKSCNEEHEKEKNLNSPNYSAIQIKLTNENDQPTYTDTKLDIYLLSYSDIVHHIDTINDVKTLGDLERKGEIVRNVARTRKSKRIGIENALKEMSR